MEDIGNQFKTLKSRVYFGDKYSTWPTAVKFSLTLLCLLLYLQKNYPIPFELGAVHIEPDFQPGHEERRISLEKLLGEYQLPFASIRMSLDLEQASLRFGR